MSTNRNVQAKNRAPASIQITAEQILREAKDRQLDVEVKAPRQQITDAEELRVFRMRKRKEVRFLKVVAVKGTTDNAATSTSRRYKVALVKMRLLLPLRSSDAESKNHSCRRACSHKHVETFRVCFLLSSVTEDTILRSPIVEKYHGEGQ